MERFDFSAREYQHFKEVCPFTDEELVIIDMRRRGKSIVQMSLALHLSDAAIHRRLKSIKKKIAKEI